MKKLKKKNKQNFNFQNMQNKTKIFLIVMFETHKKNYK